MGNLIVGAIFAIILYFAFNKVVKSLKKGSCAGCSGCQNKK